MTMSRITFEAGKTYDFVKKEEITALFPQAVEALNRLKTHTSPGSDFLGWLNLPAETTPELIQDIENTASELRSRTNVVVVVGIGGSYLGARAVIEALENSFHQYDKADMKIVFAGHNISEDYYHELAGYLADKEFGICVISKSGTTTESAIAFRLLKEMLETKVGREEAGKRIIAITDEHKGALRTLANQEGYKTYTIPDDIGGRFSVLTPVGLFPIALAGFDIRALIQGATEIRKDCLENDSNIAVEYAATRSALYRRGFLIELLANFNPKLHFITEWWKQLYGESEGKEHKGIFPAGVDFTTDLHSMGQYIQQGSRILMETVITVDKPKHKVLIPSDAANLDQLNFLAGKRIDEVNKMAELGTQIAHVDGGVPNMRVLLPELSERYIGQLMYFFELACAISGCMLGINPFDQPGVEDYKNNMFALLNKPGYEKESESIKVLLSTRFYPQT